MVEKSLLILGHLTAEDFKRAKENGTDNFLPSAISEVGFLEQISGESLPSRHAFASKDSVLRRLNSALLDLGTGVAESSLRALASLPRRGRA